MHNGILLTVIALLMSVALVASLAAPSPAQAAETGKSSKEKLTISLKVWLKSKADAGGNYTYQVSRSSFTGARWVTTIVVRDNKIVERRFEEFGGRPQLIRPGEKPKKQALGIEQPVTAQDQPPASSHRSPLHRASRSPAGCGEWVNRLDRPVPRHPRHLASRLLCRPERIVRIATPLA